MAGTLKRVKAYAGTGVDAVFLVGIETREQLDAVADSIDIPIFLGSSPEELKDLTYLASRRVRISNLGHHPIMAALQAVYDTMKALREGQAPSTLSGVASKALIRQVTRDADYQQWIHEFLGNRQEQ